MNLPLLSQAWARLRREPVGPPPAAADPHAESAQTATQPPLPPVARPILSADTLLQPHAERIAALKELAGLPEDAWQRLYAPVLERFARFVQELPASEAHHHARFGGLLTHALEVAVLSLCLRRAHLRPRDLLLEAVDDGAAFLDLGANIGYWSARRTPMARPPIRRLSLCATTI